MEISRQRNSEKLLKSELKYRNLVECSRDMIILCNNDGRIKYSNRIFHELTGISTKRGKTIDLYSLFPQTHRDRVREVIAASVQNGSPTEPLELRMKTQSRGDLWIEMMVNSVSREMQGFQIVARDITRRKSLETLVGNLSAFQEKILQNDFIGIITTDLSGKITSWNTGASLILGYGASEALDRNIAEFVINDDSPAYHEFASRNLSPRRSASRDEDAQKGEARRHHVYRIGDEDEKDQPSRYRVFLDNERSALERSAGAHLRSTGAAHHDRVARQARDTAISKPGSTGTHNEVHRDPARELSLTRVPDYITRTYHRPREPCPLHISKGRDSDVTPQPTAHAGRVRDHQAHSVIGDTDRRRREVRGGPTLTWQGIPTSP